MAKANVLEPDGLEGSFMIEPDIEPKLSPDINPAACLPTTASDLTASCEGGVYSSPHTELEPKKCLERFGGTHMSRKH